MKSYFRRVASNQFRNHFDLNFIITQTYIEYLRKDVMSINHHGMVMQRKNVVDDDIVSASSQQRARKTHLKAKNANRNEPDGLVFT